MIAATTARRPRRAAPTRREARVLRHAYATSGAAAMAVAPDHVPQAVPAPRPRPAERPDHLRVVAPSERVRRRLTPGVAVLLTAGLFATLLAVAVSHTLLVEGQVRLDALDSQLGQEQAKYQELRTQVAQLESPERIVQAANEMGMVTPDDLRYLQPTTPDASTVGPTTGDDDEPLADPTVGAGSDRTWADVKPLLEAPAP
jgi:cell division protein FtsL